MARYRLLLLEAPPRAAEGMEALPPGVDAAAFAALRGRPFTGAVVLGAGDDGAELEAAVVALQRAGLAVCVVDDSTAWIRLVDTLSTALGFATVREAGGAGAATATAPAARRDEPGLREARDPRWARAAIVGAALLVPIAGAGVASLLFGDRLYDEVAAAVESAEAPEGAANGAERRLTAHAGSGRDEGAADAPTPAGRGAGAGPTPSTGGAAGGASVALSESAVPEAPAPDATAPPRRSARRAVAAVVAALLGLGVAVLAGEGVERATRARAAAWRRRLRRAVAGAAALGALLAAMAVWRSAAASAVPPPAPAAEPVRAVVPAAAQPADRCGGGPFARFVCRSHAGPPTPRREARPFTSLLSRYRARAPRATDAGVASAVDAATTDGTRAHRSRHGRRHHRERAATGVADAATAAGPASTAAGGADASAAVGDDASVAVEPTAPTVEPAAVAVEPAAIEAPAAEPTEAPRPPTIEAPRRRAPSGGWLGGWFALGLVLGLWAAPGWRRLGRVAS